MKKLIALLMVCGFAFAFVACGGGKTESTETEMTEDTGTTEPAMEEPAMDSVASDTTSMQ
ncbi:MAG TPA: hypothetical protein PKN99_01585 [Cyclobacteriaceae bacterium]|nr:hypothetical protein [Cyclobacteriaceae bacterium]HNP06282.1 hypothetical protein [Cyclobacteriaceae bacterium]HRK54585.1 hypothetical protein [Cyclobacteriaceae bacterium]